MKQYPGLLGTYDDHPPFHFGWEDADREISDDDDKDGGTPAAAREDKIAVDDEVATAASAHSSESPDGGERTATMPDVPACSKATDALTLEEEREARKELSEQSDGKRSRLCLLRPHC